MAELSQFVDDVSFHAKTCPRPIIINAVKTAIMDFCKHSNAWVFDCDEITTTATENKYQLNIPTDAMITYVHSLHGRHLIHPCNELTQRRDPLKYHIQHPDTFVIDKKTLIADEKYTLIVSLMPKQDALDCADIIYDRYKPVIVAGAAAILLMQLGTTWENSAMAGTQFSLFMQGVSDAKRDIDNGLELAAPDYRTAKHYF